MSFLLEDTTGDVCLPKVTLACSDECARKQEAQEKKKRRERRVTQENTLVNPQDPTQNSRRDGVVSRELMAMCKENMN